MTGWEKEWPRPDIKLPDREAALGPDMNEWFKQQPGMFDPKLYNDTVPNSDKTIISKDGWPTVSEQIKAYPKNITNTKELKSQGSNLVDAEAYLYFQCEACQTILDPHTRSFARLQQVRVDKGWKCVWNTNGLGYNVYCPKCGNGK